MTSRRIEKTSTSSYGSLLEKIEILRSSLRWASRLERDDIQKLLRQCNELREEAVQQFRKERFVTSSGTRLDGSGDDEASKTQTVGKGPSKRAKKAVANGVWIVREGDTLAGISEQTGIDVDELLQLNPDLDPQALLQGQRIALR